MSFDVSTCDRGVVRRSGAFDAALAESGLSLALVAMLTLECVGEEQLSAMWKDE